MREPSSERKKKEERDVERNGVSAIMLRAGAAENKLNRLPSLKDVKLFHPVQLTPPVRVYLTRRAGMNRRI